MVGWLVVGWWGSLWAPLVCLLCGGKCGGVDGHHRRRATEGAGSAHHVTGNGVLVAVLLVCVLSAGDAGGDESDAQ